MTTQKEQRDRRLQESVLQALQLKEATRRRAPGADGSVHAAAASEPPQPPTATSHQKQLLAGNPELLSAKNLHQTAPPRVLRAAQR